MASIRLDWDEATGHLPMVCAFCGRRAVTLVTSRQRAYGRAVGLLPVVRHTSANVTLPRCERHRRTSTNIFNVHAATIDDHGVTMKFVSQRFVDAVLDRREDEDRPDPVRSSGSSGCLIASLVFFGVMFLCILTLCIGKTVFPDGKTRPTAPRDTWEEFEKEFRKGKNPQETPKERFDRRMQEIKGVEVAPRPRPVEEN